MACGSFKKRRTDGLLQFLDTPGERRLRNMQRISRSVKALQFNHCLKSP
jgi:hypothetical protein